MTIVERFIEVNNWPTSRKTALLSGLILPAHLAGWLIARFAFAADGVVKLVVFDQVFAAGAVVLSFMFTVSLVATWRGAEGRWTAYLFTTLYGAFIAALVVVFGLWSTPQVAWYPVAVVLIALYFDARIGWFGFIYGLCAIAMVQALHAGGLLPYAPGLQERSIDAQHTAGWIVGNLACAGFAPLFCFVIGQLAVAARKLQDARLREAHRQLASSTAQLERSNQLIRRYVPSQIADQIVSGHHDAAERHERRKLTIFFSDLVGFTDISEELEPEDLSRVLNQYFSEMTAIAHKHAGTVDELSGDAILIFFGAPVATDDKDHALRAVRMAADMQQAVIRLNDGWKNAGVDVVLKVRMGISTGVVTIGNFGSPDRMKYAALGKHVNLAARLQAQCEPGKVLISHPTWLLVSDQVQCAARGEMQFKGIHNPVMTYELAGAAS